MNDQPGMSYRAQWLIECVAELADIRTLRAQSHTGLFNSTVLLLSSIREYADSLIQDGVH